MKSIYTELANEFCKDVICPPVIPPSVEIDLTNLCNQDCIYCNSVCFRKESKRRAGRNDYIQLIRHLSNFSESHGNKLRTITFTGGGEPTLFPDYEDLIKYAIERGFLVSLVTNGTNLDKLLNIDVNTLRQISWIGVDVDAGTKELYNKIRRPKNQDDFEKVKYNMKDLASIGVNIDMKVLVVEENHNSQALSDIFYFAMRTGSRNVYLRPSVIDGHVFKITDQIKKEGYAFASAYDKGFKVNTSRCITRNYGRCYSLFLVPVFSSDGYVYLCCENRGNKDFMLCDWVSYDFRHQWGGTRHCDIFRNTEVSKCAPCRANIHNVEIQNCLTRPFDDLFF